MGPPGKGTIFSAEEIAQCRLRKILPPAAYPRHSPDDSTIMLSAAEVERRLKELEEAAINAERMGTVEPGSVWTDMTEIDYESILSKRDYAEEQLKRDMVERQKWENEFRQDYLRDSAAHVMLTVGPTPELSFLRPTWRKEAYMIRLRADEQDRMEGRRSKMYEPVPLATPIDPTPWERDPEPVIYTADGRMIHAMIQTRHRPLGIPELPIPTRNQSRPVEEPKSPTKTGPNPAASPALAPEMNVTMPVAVSMPYQPPMDEDGTSENTIMEYVPWFRELPEVMRRYAMQPRPQLILEHMEDPYSVSIGCSGNEPRTAEEYMERCEGRSPMRVKV